MSKYSINRRTVLKGLGAAVSLPWLEAMSPLATPAHAAGQPGDLPRRLAFFFIPNGAHMPAWTPEQEGTNFSLPPTLEPLAGVQDQLLVLSGLAHAKANANGDGPGDHARSASCYLTATQAHKTAGADIRVGVSVDQVAAEKVGQATRFASLELGCEHGLNAGNCDSGYSCAYSHNISWKTASTPMAKEINPRAVFDRLFDRGPEGELAEARLRRERERKSILDFVQADAKRLQDKLGRTDRKKLDEYLTGVRELEQRIERSEQETARALPPTERPDGIPQDRQDHIVLMNDLLALAFQADLTRVATFMLANEGSNLSYPFLDVREGHHDLSHHGRDADKQAKIAKINRFHMEQFAKFAEKLKSMPEGEGNVLDNSLIVYGGAIGDGDAHNHDELPMLLLGRGGGTVTPGRHVRYERGTPAANFYLSLLERMDVSLDAFGDSRGKLADLKV
ncbi:MAG: DUF1552 domain-containing protein [Pirellulales bacterium]